MSEGFVIGAIALVGAMLLVLAGVSWFRRRGHAGATDAAQALRRLLLERAEGRLSAEEFEKRQAAIHASLLAARPGSARSAAAQPGHGLLVFGVLALAAIASGGVGLYLYLAQPIGISSSVPMRAPSAQPGQAPAPGQPGHAGELQAMVTRLEEKLEKEPSNGEGWLLLAKSYVELREHAKAAAAFEKAIKFLPADASLLSDYVDARVMANARQWDAGARDALERALKVDPRHLKSLSLAGTEAFDRKDYRAAAEYWGRLRAAAPPGSPEATQAESNIAEAQALASGKVPATPGAPSVLPGMGTSERPAAGTAPAAPSSDTGSKGSAKGDGKGPAKGAAQGASITGRVDVEARVRSKISPTDTIFVVARAVDGSAPPLGMLRFRASELPISFTLDDSSAIAPARTLSAFKEAMVYARVSPTGDALPAPGELSSESVRVKPGAKPLVLVLGREAPGAR